MLNPHILRQHMIRICHLLAEKDYVSAMDGNVSARLSTNTFLATPTKVHKGFITEDELLVVDAHGKKLEGRPDKAPTSEIFMHLAIYARRPDVQAVVHAHPPTAIAMTLAGETLARCVLPEIVLTLGQIPTAEYYTTGSLELAERVGELMTTYDALLLDRHGAICAGSDLVDAFGKMEKVEHTAMITHRARMLGRVRELDCDEVSRLRRIGIKYSSKGQVPPICEGCEACSSHTPWAEQPFFPVGRVSQHQGADGFATSLEGTRNEAQQKADLERIITEEVVRALSSR